jgi:hypothetical protein
LESWNASSLRSFKCGEKVAQEELENEAWLRAVSHLSKRSYEQVRVMILEFLDTDIFNVSLEIASRSGSPH